MSNLEILFAAIIVMAIVAGLLHSVTRKPKVPAPPTLQAMREEALFDAQRQLHLFLLERDALEGNIGAMRERVARMQEDLGHDAVPPLARGAEESGVIATTIVTTRPPL